MFFKLLLIVFSAMLSVACGSNNSSLEEDKETGELTTSIWKESSKKLVRGGRPLSAINNGENVYVFGASDKTSTFRTVEISDISSEGLLGEFYESENFLQEERFLEGVTLYNNFIYVVGGDYQGEEKSTEFTSINQDGTINVWEKSTRLLNIGRNAHQLVQCKGYLYAIGGNRDSGVDLKSIEFSKINTDGSISNWVMSETELTQTKVFHGAVCYEDKIYIVGGDGNSESTTIEMSEVKENGVLSDWNSLLSATAPGRKEFVVYKNHLVLVGGYFKEMGETYRSVEIGKLNNEGFIESWSTQKNNLINERSDFGISIYENYIYIFGGSYSSKEGRSIGVTSLSFSG